MFSIVTDLKTSKIRYFSLLDDNFEIVRHTFKWSIPHFNFSLLLLFAPQSAIPKSNIWSYLLWSFSILILKLIFLEILKSSFHSLAISKLYKTVLNIQMVEHFYVLFSKLLTAFRKSYSCQTLLIKFIEDRKAALGKCHVKGTVYMDLSKAFDCLPHSLLMTKRHAYGLFKAACETMFYYLQDREQRIRLIF